MPKIEPRQLILTARYGDIRRERGPDKPGRRDSAGPLADAADSKVRGPGTSLYGNAASFNSFKMPPASPAGPVSAPTTLPVRVRVLPAPSFVASASEMRSPSN